jgi:N-acetylglucosamine-6-phosphate deacetylase
MSEHVLNNARIWPGDGRAFDGHLTINDGTIVSVNDGPYQGDLPSEDLNGAALSPGLIDLMLLGGFGKSIFRDDPSDILFEYLQLGVSSCQVCTGTLPWNVMEQICENLRPVIEESRTDRSTLLGIYFEGPFQHPEQTGASLADHALPPSVENVERLLSFSDGIVRMVNISPGTEGDAEAIRLLRDRNITVSMAHSNVHATRIKKCLEAGTRILGHCWNNHSGALIEKGVHRPTLEHVALMDERIEFIHLICDGVHVDPDMIRFILHCRSLDSLILVTDAVPLAGRDDGEFVWDDGRTFKKKDRVGRTDIDVLCGSGLLLPDHLRNFINITGTPAHEAIRAVTYNPAKSIGLDKDIGLLAEGRRADIVAWDDQLMPIRIWKDGQPTTVPPSHFAEIALT